MDIVRGLVALALACIGACDRGPPRDRAATANPPQVVAPGSGVAAAPAAGPAAAVPSCTLAVVPLRIPAARRVVAIGDLHGDLAATRAALRAAGAIDAQDRWIGGDLVVVQTGEVLDRGDGEHAILDLIARLETEARAAGGAVVALLGNHELMNAAGDFRYVTPAGFHDFDGVAGPAAAMAASAPEGQRSRVAALGPGGSYARRLAQHAVVAIVGDTVFSHAGVLGDWVTHIDDTNRASRCFLDGQARTPPPAATADDSPLWTRAVGTGAPDCAAVKTALAAMHLGRMVVAHTVQEHGITSACGETLWRIDVGLARLYNGPIQVLQVYPKVEILTGQRL